jgi:hypothetical protein
MSWNLFEVLGRNTRNTANLYVQAAEASSPEDALKEVVVTAEKKFPAKQSTSISKNNASKILSFPSNIEGYVPHIYIKVYKTETGSNIQREQGDPSASLVSGAASALAVAGEYKTELATLYGAWKAAKSTVDFASYVSAFDPKLAGSLVAGGVIVGGASGFALEKTAEAALESFFQTRVGADVKSSLKNLAFRRNITQLASSIFLAMPEGIAVQYNQDYDAISVTNATGGPGSLFQAMSDIKAANNITAVSPYLIEAAGKIAESKAGGEGLAKLTFFGATGMAVNPQMEMIYTAPQLRTFNFDFRLVPRNAIESQAIANIIKHLKMFSSPTLSTGNQSGRFFIPPHQFEIEFYDRNNNMYGSSSLPYLYKTKKCVLKSINIEYAGGGAFATFRDGAPVETRMALEFQETTILDSADMEAGY